MDGKLEILETEDVCFHMAIEMGQQTLLGVKLIQSGDLIAVFQGRAENIQHLTIYRIKPKEQTHSIVADRAVEQPVKAVALGNNGGFIKTADSLLTLDYETGIISYLCRITIQPDTMCVVGKLLVFSAGT